MVCQPFFFSFFSRLMTTRVPSPSTPHFLVSKHTDNFHKPHLCLFHSQWHGIISHYGAVLCVVRITRFFLDLYFHFLASQITAGPWALPHTPAQTYTCTCTHAPTPAPAQTPSHGHLHPHACPNTRTRTDTLTRTPAPARMPPHPLPHGRPHTHPCTHTLPPTPSPARTPPHPHPHGRPHTDTCTRTHAP